MRIPLAPLRKGWPEVLATLVIVGLVASPIALAGRGVGAKFHLGKVNRVNKTTELRGRVEGPSLRLVNNSLIPTASALSLSTESGIPPMRVDSSTEVENLNADLLGGKSDTAFLSSTVYRVESPIEANTQIGDGTFTDSMTCNPGDRLLSGGPANIAPTSELLESYPSSTTTWSARIDKNAQTDNWNVVVLCANQ